MHLKDLLIGLGSFVLSIFGLVLVWRQEVNLSLHPNIKERIGRALIGGLGLLIFVTSGLVTISTIGFPSSERVWSLESSGGLLCIAVPACLLATVGLFIRFSTRGAIHGYFSRRLDEIAQNLKKQK